MRRGDRVRERESCGDGPRQPVLAAALRQHGHDTDGRHGDGESRHERRGGEPHRARGCEDRSVRITQIEASCPSDQRSCQRPVGVDVHSPNHSSPKDEQQVVAVSVGQSVLQHGAAFNLQRHTIPFGSHSRRLELQGVHDERLVRTREVLLQPRLRHLLMARQPCFRIVCQEQQAACDIATFQVSQVREGDVGMSEG